MTVDIKKPSLGVWTDVSKHNVDKIINSETSSQLHICVQNVMQLPDSMQGQILCDMYISAIKFAKLHSFTPLQISTFMSILKQVHNVCTSTPFGNFEDTFLYFKELMLLHSVNRPPWSLKIFDTAELTIVSQYVQDTYFRHFKMYKYAFTPKIKLDLSLSYEGRAPSPEPSLLAETEPDTESVAANDSELVADHPVETELVEEEDPGKKETDNQVIVELETIIKKAITSQIKQLSTSVEQQLIDTDKAITGKIQSLEGRGSAKAKGRSPKSSAKSRKK